MYQPDGGALRVVIVDDKSAHRTVLVGRLAACGIDVEVVGKAAGFQDGLDAVKTHRPDAVLVDIKLGRGVDGFDLVRQIQVLGLGVPAIMVSDDERQGHRTHVPGVVDYVYKSDGPKRFGEALMKIPSRVVEDHETSIRVYIRGMDRIVPLHVIAYITRKDKMTFLYYDGKFDGEHHRDSVDPGISDFEGVLRDKGFCRIHESTLVRLDKIRDHSTKDGRHIHLLNGKRLNASKSYWGELMGRLPPKVQRGRSSTSE